MDKKTIFLSSQIGRVLAKKMIDDAPEDWACTIEEKTRTLEQNAKLHAMITDISKQVIWCGQKLPLHVWKRLCVAAWLREKNEKPLLVPALDGHGVDIIYEKTSKLGVKQCAELIEWCYMFGSEHNVKFRETRYDSDQVRLSRKNFNEMQGI